jgi:hypothetical protein
MLTHGSLNYNQIDKKCDELDISLTPLNMLKFGQNEQKLFFEFENLPEIFKTSKREFNTFLNLTNHFPAFIENF